MNFSMLAVIDVKIHKPPYHLAKGKCEDADLLYQRALKIQENVYGEDHPEVAVTLINWAKLLETQVSK